jgi:hypothetical protein
VGEFVCVFFLLKMLMMGNTETVNCYNINALNLVVNQTSPTTTAPR